MSEQRKATDVLLSVEQKLDVLINLIRSKDLSDKILSNKLNKLLSILSENKAPPTFTAETVNTTTTVQINSEQSLSMASNPSEKGFSRTSRPETFSGDNSYLQKPNKKEQHTKMPVQVPKGNHVEIVVPQEAINLNKKIPSIIPPSNIISNHGSGVVSIVQRVVDKNGKSVFLAEVEIIDASSIEVVQKLKTNGTGKWMTSLPIGTYNIIVRKRDPITKDKIDIPQNNIIVDGSVNPLELPVMIIK